MWSKALIYKLKPGRYPEYRKVHDKFDELWPELAKAMTENQVNMVILHHEERLHLYVTAPTEEHFTRSHAGEVADRWNEYMATMSVTGSEGETLFEEMDIAFAFGRYRDELAE